MTYEIQDRRTNRAILRLESEQDEKFIKRDIRKLIKKELNFLNPANLVVVVKETGERKDWL